MQARQTQQRFSRLWCGRPPRAARLFSTGRVATLAPWTRCRDPFPACPRRLESRHAVGDRNPNHTNPPKITNQWNNRGWRRHAVLHGSPGTRPRKHSTTTRKCHQVTQKEKRLERWPPSGNIQSFECGVSGERKKFMPIFIFLAKLCFCIIIFDNLILS